MSLPKLKDTYDRVKRPMAAGALALSMAFSPMAMAEDNAASASVGNSASHSTVSTKVASVRTKTAGELAGIAQDYSIKNKDAIGFFLVMGPEDPRDPREFGLNIRKRIARDGFKSNFTYAFAKTGESGIDFYVNGKGYTEYGMDKIEEGYNKALKHAKNIRDTNLIARQVAYNNN